MEKEQAMKMAKEILEELDSWVNLDSLYEPSCNGDGTYYDECVEIVADFIYNEVNKCLQ